MDIASWLTIANFLILLLGIIGGVLALRSAKSQTESTIQERVREALTTENALLQARIQRLERDNKRLNRLLTLIVTALKKTLNIELEVEDDAIILHDPKDHRRTIRIEAPDTA